MRLALASVLHAAPEDVWARAGTVDGVNLELAPWLRITAPREVRRLEDLPVGCRAFRAWVLALGLIPVDRHELALVRVEPLHGFLERSRSALCELWEHERTLVRVPAGTLLTDRLEIRVRRRVPAAAHAALVGAVFRHRHRRLRAAFGGGAA